ncbi:MAG: hypothetical protein HY075_06300 [Deltaproteobacteria bacterium]|nr:hypothetical protein [Deltaproteobacteria bacterium]
MQHRRSNTLAALAVVVLCYCAVLALQRARHPGADPGRWFHLGISHLVAEHPLLRTVPQAEDIGWGNRFVEPDFLFHVLSGVAYRVGGDRAVVALSRSIACAMLVAFFLLARLWAPPAVAAALVVATTLTSLHLAPRLFQERPQLAAMVALAALIAGVVRGKRAWVFFAAAAFVLTHHAYFVPALTIVAAVATAKPRDQRMLALAGFGGVAAGILLNPHFPLNITGAYTELRIAFWGMPDPGMELEREPLLREPFLLVRAFGLGLACWLAAAWAWTRTTGTAKEPLSFLLGAAGALWLLAIESPSAGDYALPVSALAAAAAWPVLRGFRVGRPSGAWALAALALVQPFAIIRRELREPPEDRYALVARAVREALDTIPASARGRKVLNCETEYGALTLYARPDLRFVDLLHPLLLRFADASKYETLRALKLSIVGDPVSVAHRVFDADYLLCQRPAVNVQLRSDPRARLLYDDPVTEVALFELGAETHRDLVSAYELRLLEHEKDVHDPTVVARFPRSGEAVSANLVDLFEHFGAGTLGVIRCAWLRPTPAQLAAHAGARSISFGGGPHTRLWLNGRLLHSSDPYLPSPKMVQKTIALPKPLSASDRLDAVVCRKKASYWTFALWLNSK